MSAPGRAGLAMLVAAFWLFGAPARADEPEGPRKGPEGSGPFQAPLPEGPRKGPEGSEPLRVPLPEAAGHYRAAQAAERSVGPQADAQAIAHYLKAAGLGHPRAQVALAGHYLSGKGVARDLEAAVRWYGRAAVQGDGEAFYKLGALYQRGGAGVKAYACYRLAMALANGDARRRATGGLARLAPRLTSAERREAEELAAGWRVTIDR